MAPRRAALRLLTEARRGQTLDAVRDRVFATLTPPDRRLAHEIAAGVMRQRTALDTMLAPLVPRGWAAVDPKLQDVLRLGAYQLAMLDRIPRHAAVGTSVALAKAHGGARAGGFVNAVLRKLAARPAPERSSGEAAAVRTATGAVDAIETLANAHSHPAWLVARWVARFGAADTARLLAWNNTRPRLVVQPARLDIEGLDALLRAAGIETIPAPYGAGIIVDHTRPDELPGYREGDFLVQDPAQALLAWYADLDPGSVVYDACAAPGGKAVTTARHAGLVVAGDINPQRARRLLENVQRAGTGREHALVADARRPPLRPAAADVVLLDVPCLGTGTFARHPDARWRVTADALTELIGLQAALLDGVADLVAPGGLLLYSTCSLEPEENEQQVDRFLARRPALQREPSPLFPAALQSAAGDLVILPHRDGMDGAYAARLRRRPSDTAEDIL